MSEESTSETPANSPSRSPFAGCLIIILILLMITFLITFVWWTGKKQTEEIAKFTDEKSAPVTLLDPQEHSPALDSLHTRLTQFHQNVTEGTEAQLALTPLELNLAIAQHEEFAELRHTFFITSITPDSLNADISYQLGTSPLSDRENHLNASITAQPTLNNGYIYLDITAITPSRGTVPDAFQQHFAKHHITKPYIDHPHIGPLMAKLTALELSDGTLTLIYDPSHTPPTSTEEAKRSSNKTRNLFALFALIFILTMILFFILMSRRKKLKKLN